MRLIDADAFERQVAGMTIANSYSVNKANALCELIDAQPTAYSVDKIVEELEKIKGLACDGKSCSECEYTSDCFNGEQSEKVAIDKAIEIVNQGGVSDDVCEWKMDNVGASIGCRSDLHHTGYVNRTYCPYCRKKIKVVE